MEGYITTVSENSSITFKQKLLNITKQAIEIRKEGQLYIKIDQRIRQQCEQAAYNNKNCVYVGDLHLEDFIPYLPYDRYNNRYRHELELETMVEIICKDLELDIRDGYITWTSS